MKRSLMDGTNRAIATVFGLILFGAGATFVLGALLVAGPFVITLSDGEQWMFTRLSPGDQVMAIALGLTTGVVGLFICALEYLGPPRGATMVVRDRERHRVEIEVAPLATVIRRRIEQLAGVVEVAVRLEFVRQQASVHLLLLVEDTAHVTRVVDSAQGVVRAVCEEDLGLAPTEVMTTVRHVGSSQHAVRGSR